MIHTWLLIYVLLSQYMSNDNNKKLDRKVEDSPRKLLECRLELLSDVSHADALYDRFQQQGGTENLEESITLYRQGLKLCPNEDPIQLALFNNLATAFFTRFKHLGILQDLEEAIP